MNVFNRTINVNIQTDNGKTVIVNGVFLDSFHELCLTLQVDMDTFTIINADGELKRIPQPDCKVTEKRIAQLIGLRLEHGVRKQLREAVGGQTGCTHLAELALQCIQSLVQAKYALMHEVLSQEEIDAQSEAFLKGSCYHFRLTK